MNLREQLKAAIARAGELQKAAAARDLTDDEIKEANDLPSKVEDLRAKIKAADDANAALNGLASSDGDADPDDDGTGDGTDPDDTGTGNGKNRTRRQYKDRDDPRFGRKFIHSEAYKRFAKDHPGGVGNGTPIDIGRVKVGTLGQWHTNRKASATLDSTVARTQPTRFPMIDQVDRDRLTLLDLVSRGEADGAFEYVQVVGVTRNAAIVAEGELKPTSDLQTDLADAKPYTYADGYDVTNQLLSDAPAFASYMDNELEYSLDNVVEEKLLNGAGTSGEPRGLLNTTGVQQQPFDTDMVRSVRKGITRITRLGGQVTAVLMSPEDDEEWDLMKDGNERYYGQGPFGSGPNTAWGRPRAVSERLAPGQVILGDFRQMALLDVEGLSILAFNQHADYAKRNKVYVRAELRAVQAIWKPNRLCVVQTAANGG